MVTKSHRRERRGLDRGLGVATAPKLEQSAKIGHNRVESPP